MCIRDSLETLSCALVALLGLTLVASRGGPWARPSRCHCWPYCRCTRAKGALWVASRLPDSATRLALAVDVIAVLVGGGVIFVAGALMLQGALSAPVHPLR